MAGIAGPVCLTHTAPDHAYEGHLLLYDVVHPDVVARSGVLSSIAETGGDARLPDMVTLAEFTAWSRTVTDGNPIAKYTDMSLTCTVLKAADGLDDPCFSQWLNLTAGLLDKAASDHYDSKGVDPQHISDCLSKLPEHLQHRVFQAAAHVPGANLLSQYFLLKMLPSKHHAAVLAAAISIDKALVVPPDSQLDLVVNALTLLPASPPPLLSLDLESEVPRRRWGREHCSWEEVTARAAVHVPAALRHHSSLTRLKLSSFRGGATMFEPITRALATLTGLRVLHLGSRKNGVETDVVPLLRTALEPLSNLQDLKVCVDSLHMISRLYGKRLRGGEPSQDEPQYCLSNVLSPATALTSLELDERCGLDQYFVARSAISMPCLQRLRVSSHCHNIASTLISQLHAPLTALEIEAEPAPRWGRDHARLAQQMWAALHRFDQLQRLVVHLDCKASEEQSEHEQSEEQSEHEFALAGATDAIAALPALQELSIRAAVPLLSETFTKLAESAVAVQRLQCTCTPPQATELGEWQELFQSMSRLGLQHLGLRVDDAAPPVGLPGVAVLRQLTALTALHMRGWQSCLGAADDHEALAGMRQLHSLHVRGFAVPAALQAGVVRALGGLPCLAQLALVPADAGSGFEAALAKHARVASWSALRWLGVTFSAKARAAKIVRRATAFPGLRNLTLKATDTDRLPKAWCEELACTASDAGVSLVIESKYERNEWKIAVL